MNETLKDRYIDRLTETGGQRQTERPTDRPTDRQTNGQHKNVKQMPTLKQCTDIAVQ